MSAENFNFSYSNTVNDSQSNGQIIKQIHPIFDAINCERS